MTALFEDREGSVFLSSGFDGVTRIVDGGVTVLPARPVSGSDFDGPLYADPDGGVWSGHRDGLSYRGHGRSVLYPVRGQVTAVSRDAESIVFAVGTGEVYRLVGGRQERYRLADGSLLGPEERQGFDYVWMLHVARDGALWLATSRGALVVRAGQARRVWHRDALSARSIFEDEAGTIWLGTMVGLVMIEGDSVTTFTIRDGLPEDDVHFALSEAGRGVWLTGASGISRVERRDLEAVAHGEGRGLRVQRIGAADGMRTPVAVATHQPSACVDRMGRLWFTTTEGIAVVNPSKRTQNMLAPPVVVEAVVADDRPLEMASPVLVPAGIERLAIHYNGLSLLDPRRVRFKYQLGGYDRDWVEPEGNRVAHYTKLPPGSYTFRVKAANNDGVWNEVGASLEIRQVPWFHQTLGFLVALGMAGTGSIWGAFRIRLRRHQRLERELEGRVNEALAHVKTLRGLLPICAWCKKVRDDGGYWNQIEMYVREHTEAEFSHGICPDCSNAMGAAVPSRERGARRRGSPAPGRRPPLTILLT